MTKQNGNGDGANERDIDATIIAGALEVFDHDGHQVVRLHDVVSAAIEAAFNLGLEGEEAEQMAEYIQRELVEVMVAAGVGIIDERDGKLWVPGRETKQ